MSLVTVGCKLPAGILMQLGHGEAKKTVKLNGVNAAKVIGGFGLTDNVDEAFFDEWVRVNGELKFLKAGHVFKMPSVGEATARAMDYEKLRSGMEPLDPNKTPRGVEEDPQQKVIRKRAARS